MEFTNWSPLTDDHIKQEYEWEYLAHQKSPEFNPFPTLAHFANAIKQYGKIINWPKQEDMKTGNRSRVSSIEHLKQLTSQYRFPRDVDRIVRGFSNNEPIPVPIILKQKGNQWMMSGNTRLNTAHILGINPKVMLLDIDQIQSNGDINKMYKSKLLKSLQKLCKETNDLLKSSNDFVDKKWQALASQPKNESLEKQSQWNSMAGSIKGAFGGGSAATPPPPPPPPPPPTPSLGSSISRGVSSLMGKSEDEGNLNKGCGVVSSDKWKRCVAKVKAKGEVKSPEAVCTASLQKDVVDIKTGKQIPQSNNRQPSSPSSKVGEKPVYIPSAGAFYAHHPDHYKLNGVHLLMSDEDLSHYLDTDTLPLRTIAQVNNAKKNTNLPVFLHPTAEHLASMNKSQGVSLQKDVVDIKTGKQIDTPNDRQGLDPVKVKKVMESLRLKAQKNLHNIRQLGDILEENKKKPLLPKYNVEPEFAQKIQDLANKKKSE